VAAVQYTFTHKKYTEYTERTIHNNKKEKKLESAGRAPFLCFIYPDIRFTTEEKAQKTSVRVVEKCPDIPVAAVQYTFTHKQYTEQHNETIHRTEHITVRIFTLTKEHFA
jgi:hypothetical protein